MNIRLYSSRMEPLPGYDAWKCREPDEYLGPANIEVEVEVVRPVPAVLDEGDDFTEYGFRAYLCPIRVIQGEACVGKAEREWALNDSDLEEAGRIARSES